MHPWFTYLQRLLYNLEPRQMKLRDSSCCIRWRCWARCILAKPTTSRWHDEAQIPKQNLEQQHLHFSVAADM